MGEKHVYRLRGRRKKNVEVETPVATEPFMQRDPRECAAVVGTYSCEIIAGPRP